MSRNARRSLAGAILAALAVVQGCALIGWVAAVATPPETIEARYHIPKENRLLVIVEDSGRLAGFPGARSRLIAMLNRALRKQGVVSHVVDQRRLVNQYLSNPNFEFLSDLQKGEKVGADVILSIHIDRFTLKNRPLEPWNGVCEFTVKLLDVAAGEQLWPQFKARGERMACTVKPDDGRSFDDNYRRPFTAKVVDTVVDMVAKLFYDHEGRNPIDLPEKEY